jgi:hypothetical protein
VSLLQACGASLEATLLAVERAMGASLAGWEAADDSIRDHETARMREATVHAARSEILMTSLRSAATDFGSYIGEHEVGEPSSVTGRPSLKDLLSDEELGRVVATGIDPRLLEVKVAPSDGFSSVSVGEALTAAGDAAEGLGRALGIWAREARL